jgi:hypothetical protein
MSVPRPAVVRAAFALVAVAAALSACQYLAGVQSRSADPLPSGCVLPSGPGPQVRVANFVPSADFVDVCIRPSGGAWGEPLILGGGSGCSTTFPASAPGFGFGQVSVTFTAPGARVDVKMVPGGRTCSAAPLTEADGVALASDAVTTLARIGGNGVAQQLVALPESSGAPPAGAGLYRVVHAMPGVGPIDFGGSDQAHLPTTIDTLFLQESVPYSHAPTAGGQSFTGPVAAGGYVGILPGLFNLALGVHGSNAALVLEPGVEVASGAWSFYLAGIQGSVQYPPQGFLCDEQPAQNAAANPLIASCTRSALPTIAVDTFNASLYGPNAPDWQQRKIALAGMSELTQSSADVICVAEVDEPTEQQAIIGTAATGAFKYSYAIQTDLSTPFTDPRTQDGGTPPAPKTPPCGGSVPASAVTAAMTCMEQYCSSAGPGDPSGQLLTTTDCLTSNCTGALSELFIGYPACFDCLLDYVASTEPYGTAQKQCTQSTQAPFAFEGATPNFILSRYPLAKTDRYILTSTLYRAAVLYAQVQLEDGLDVDFYCGQLSSTLIASDLPYTGNYGAGATTSQDGYDNEQTWQATQLVRWVASKSGKNPAIVTGDWHSGVGGAGGTNDAGWPLALPLSAQAVNVMFGASGWSPASTPTWAQTPPCNICPCGQNALECPGSDSYFVLQPFLVNWPHGSAAVVDERLSYTDAPLMTVDGGSVPLSQYFGVTIHVLRPTGP